MFGYIMLSIFTLILVAEIGFNAVTWRQRSLPDNLRFVGMWLSLAVLLQALWNVQIGVQTDTVPTQDPWGHLFLYGILASAAGAYISWFTAWAIERLEKRREFRERFSRI